MVGVASTGMRIMLATDDSASARTAEEWVTRLRYGKPPIIDVVCVAGRGGTRLGWGFDDLTAGTSALVGSSSYPSRPNGHYRARLLPDPRRRT